MAVDPGGGGRAWPGLTVRSGEMRMDPDALRAAADTLASEFEALNGQSSGSLSQLSSTTSQPTGTSFFGGWDVAREMAEGYRVAQEAIVEGYGHLLQELGNAINLLYSTAGGTEGTDQYGAGGFRSQQVALEGSGDAGSGPPVEVREA